MTFYDDDGGSSASASAGKRGGHVLLQKRRGSRSLVTAAGTAVGVHWDIAEAKYASGAPSPEPERDYGLAVAADAELALLLGAGGAARNLARRLGALHASASGGGAVLVSRREQLRGAAAAHVTRCRFREGGRSTRWLCTCAGTASGGELRVTIDGKKVAEVRQCSV